MIASVTNIFIFSNTVICQRILHIYLCYVSCIKNNIKILKATIYFLYHFVHKIKNNIIHHCANI